MKLFLLRLISFFCLLRFRLFNRRVVIGKNVIANWRFRIKGKGKVVIGDNVNLWSWKEPNEFFTFSEDAIITIGSHTRVNGAAFQCRKEITVGEKCLLGSVLILDNDFHNPDPQLRFDKINIPTKPVRIGNNVWLAGQSAVLKGVQIGDNSVVGFRAVVVKDVEANVVVAGNPAQVVKKFT